MRKKIEVSQKNSLRTLLLLWAKQHLLGMSVQPIQWKVRNFSG